MQASLELLFELDAVVGLLSNCEHSELTRTPDRMQAEQISHLKHQATVAHDEPDVDGALLLLFDWVVVALEDHH